MALRPAVWLSFVVGGFLSSPSGAPVRCGRGGRGGEGDGEGEGGHGQEGRAWRGRARRGGAGGKAGGAGPAPVGRRAVCADQPQGAPPPHRALLPPRWSSQDDLR